MLKLTRPLVVLDLETTGLDIVKDRIIEVAAIKCEPNGEPGMWQKNPASFSSLINPGRLLGEEIEALTGIKSSDLIGKPTFGAIAAELHDLIKGCDIGGFGVLGFDVPMLAEEFLRAGIILDLAGVNILDAMAVFKKRESRNLANAVKFYLNREFTGGHRADADAEASAFVLMSQSDRYNLETAADFVNAGETGRRIDPAGYIAEDAHGEAIFTFGKNKDKPVVMNWDYASWMLRENFPEYTKRVIRSLFPQVFKAAAAMSPPAPPQQVSLI